MECKRTGEFTGQITEVNVVKRQFKTKESLALRLSFINAESETGNMYLDLSQDMVTGGVNMGKTQIMATRETLLALGIDISKGMGDSTRLVGTQVSVYGKEGEKGYVTFYLNTRRPEEIIDMNSINVNELFSSQPTLGGMQQPATGGFQQTAPANPFLKK